MSIPNSQSQIVTPLTPSWLVIKTEIEYEMENDWLTNEKPLRLLTFPYLQRLGTPKKE